MNSHSRGLEFKVGLFVFVGLAVLGALVVQFGRIGEGLRSYYAITVRFNDASGLLRNSDVLMAGAKIGHVAGGPRLAREGHGVLVTLRIFDHVRIPAGSQFVVGSSGLLGDRYVAVWMPPGEPKEFVQPGAQITGTRQTGVDDITREGGELVKELRQTVENVSGTFTRLNEQALSQENMDNLKSSIDRLNHATGSLAESAKKVDEVIEKAGATMDSTKKAADDLQQAIADARKTLQGAESVFRAARTGPGLLPTMLTNEELARDLRALIANMRAHGVLFYRDSVGRAEAREARERAQRPTPTPTPAPRRRPRR